MIKLACDVCGRVFQQPPPYVVASYAAMGVDVLELPIVRVINLRRREPPTHFCPQCAPIVAHILTLIGIPHRYNEYERTFFIGDELYLAKENNDETTEPTDTSLQSGYVLGRLGTPRRHPGAPPITDLREGPDET